MTAPDLAAKTARLQRLIGEMGRVALAYSGGVDSTLLLAVCRDVLGAGRVLALTARSPLLSAAEEQQAVTMTARLGVPQRFVPFDALGHPAIVANGADRCYHCKRALLTALWAAARAEGLTVLAHGANADDPADYRPGLRAAEELGVRAPLLEAGLTKADVRALARQMGLENWDLPPMACLATRVPAGTPLSAEALARVERAESCLRERLGLRQLRVRDHFPLARIEVDEMDIERLAQREPRAQIVAQLQRLGYRYVTLDLQGFRSGSMNPVALR